MDNQQPNPTPKARRTATKLLERLTPCQCCHHPVSQRHHALPFAEFGESEDVLHLCGKCHELYHTVYGAMKKRRRRSLVVLGHLFAEMGPDNAELTWIYFRVKAYLQMERWLQDIPKRFREYENQILSQHEEGWTPPQIARQFGLTVYWGPKQTSPENMYVSSAWVAAWIAKRSPPAPTPIATETNEPQK